MSESAKGQLSILVCAILWSTSGLFIKLLDWNPLVIAGGRSMLAAIFLILIRPIVREKSAPGGVTITPCFIASGIVYAATMLLFVTANKHTTSANAILLQYGAPIWAALLGWALAGEKPRREHWFALAAVIIGLCIFFKDGLSGGGITGDILAVISGITFGAHSVFMRLQKNANPADSMALAHIICTAFALPFAIRHPPVFTSTSTAVILFMGIVQLGCASFFFSYGIKRVTAVRTMLTCTIEPVLNPLWVFVVTGERPDLWAVIGGIIIVSAVLSSSLAGRLKPPKHFFSVQQ
ncbi:MAG: DMT family transporter [Spirochaetaceae bacterium]|jgi:drug/metabolite transporter (DMT)-like permease|nr:DMT family transporter [Spirochaetaceae bacterium]